jgi:hypothetical protein
MYYRSSLGYIFNIDAAVCIQKYNVISKEASGKNRRKFYALADGMRIEEFGNEKKLENFMNWLWKKMTTGTRQYFDYSDYENSIEAANK